MHAATCMRLPSRPWCLPPQLCVRKHTCSSAPQCPPHTVYPRTAAPSGSSVLVKAAAADPDPDVVAYPGVKPQPEPVPTPAAAAAVTPDGAGSSSTADPEPAKPKRVPWNKGRKHLPGTIERIKAGNAAALQRPEVQAKIKAMAEARRGVPTGRKSPQAPREKKVKVPFEDMTPEQQAAVEAARKERAERTRRLWQDPAYRAKLAASVAERRAKAPPKQQGRGSSGNGAAGQDVVDGEQVTDRSISSGKSSSSSTRGRATSKAAAVKVEVLSEDGTPIPLTSSSSSKKTRPRKPKASTGESDTSSSSGSSSSSSSSSSKRRKAGSSTAAGAEDASTAWDVPTVGSGKRARAPMPGSEGKPATSRRRAPSRAETAEKAAAKREDKEVAILLGQLQTSAHRLVQLQQLITQTNQMLANLSSAAAELVNDRLGTARLQHVAAAAQQRLQDAQEQVQELEALLQLHGASWDATSGELLQVRHPQVPDEEQQHSSSSADMAPVNGRSSTAHVVGEVVGSTDAPAHAAGGYPAAAAAAAVAVGGDDGAPLLHAELVSAAVAVEARTQTERNGGGVWL